MGCDPDKARTHSSWISARQLLDDNHSTTEHNTRRDLNTLLIPNRFLLGLFDQVEKTYCYSVFILLLLFRTDFGHGYEENCKVFKIKTYLALLHLCWTPVVKLFSFTVRHVRSPKEKMSNLDGTLNLTYNAIEILETWKRRSSCLDLQKRQRLPTCAPCRLRDIKLQTLQEGGCSQKNSHLTFENIESLQAV